MLKVAYFSGLAVKSLTFWGFWMCCRFEVASPAWMALHFCQTFWCWGRWGNGGGNQNQKSVRNPVIYTHIYILCLCKCVLAAINCLSFFLSGGCGCRVFRAVETKGKGLQRV